MNAIVTEIQINTGNDTVLFYNGTTLIKTMSRIMPSNPNFISYRYDTITITEQGQSFSFQVYPISDVGTVVYTVLNFSASPAVVEEKTIQVYTQLTTFFFQACCDCSGGGSASGCFASFALSEEGPAVTAGNISFRSLGDPSVRLYLSNLTYNSVQDFSGLYPLIEAGSWIFAYNVDDPSNYYIVQVDTVTPGVSSALFEGPMVSQAGPTTNYGALFCVDFAVSSSLSSTPTWQQTLLTGSGTQLTQDNEVFPRDFATYDFTFRDFKNINLNSNVDSVTIGTWNYASPNVYHWVKSTGIDISLVSGRFGNDVGVIADFEQGLTLKTLNYSSANPGDILVFNGQTVEYAPANAGTVSSVGLSMPAAFSVTNSPITGAGVIDVSLTGLVTEYVDGTGALQPLPVYTGDNGLNNTTTPTTIELGGTLNKNTIIQTTNGSSQYGLAVTGTVDQTTAYPFLVSNLGTGGVSSFQDYSTGTRSNPSIQVLGDVDLFQPLLELKMNGNLPNTDPLLAGKTTMLRLKYSGNPANARTSIDYEFQNSTPVAFIASRLTTEITNFTAGSENANYEIQLVRSGTLENKVVVEGKGQLELTNYGASVFADGTTNINDSLTYVLAVDSNGKIWKKLVSGGGGSGSVTQVSTAGLITTVSGLPITTIGTITTSMTDGKLVGRWTSAGTGIMQEIAIGSGLELTAGGTLQSTSIATAGSGLSQAVTVVNLGQPSKALSELNPITQDSWVYSDGFDVVFIGDKSEPIVYVENTRANSNVSPAFSALSDGGNAIVANQNFTGTITPGYIGRTAAFFGYSNVGFGISTETRLSPSGYFELRNSLTPITEPAVYIIKNERSKTTTYDEVLRIERAGPGAGNNVPGIGFGAVTSYRMRYGSPVANVALAGSHGFAWVDPTVQTSEFIVAPTLSGAENIRMKVTGAGQLKLPSYTSLGAFPGVAAGVLGFDTAGNIITVSGGGGGGGGLTGAVNGLSVVGTNAVLGGPLTGLTSISSSGFGLEITGSVPSSQNASLYVQNTNTGANVNGVWGNAVGSSSSTGVYGTSDIGRGVQGSSNSGVGVIGLSNTSIAGQFTAQSFWAIQGETNNNSGNTTQPVMLLLRNSSSTAQNNIGGSIQYSIKTSSGSIWPSNLLVSKWTNVTEASRSSQFEIHGVNNALNPSAYFTLKSTGQVQFNKYTSPSLFNGVVSAYLAVDVNGNVIQESGGPSAGITQLTGDVAASGSGTVLATIQPGVVTYSKMQAASATSRLLGAGSSTTYGEISLGTGFSIVSNTLEYSGSGSAITALTGDVVATGPGSVGAVIPNGTITYAKMQNVVTADRVLGSTVAGGPVSEVQVSTNMIVTGAVTYARMQNVAPNTFLANTTGSAVSVQEISTSRIPLFASNIGGTPSGATFLRGDGQWATPSGASPLTTKGDLYTFDTANTRLPVGTNGQVLVADNTTATGLRWTTGGGGSYTSSNGITLTGSNFGLGGNLDGDTIITHTTDSLTFTGEGSIPSGSVVKSLVHINNTQTAVGNSYGLEVLGGTLGTAYFQTSNAGGASVSDTGFAVYATNSTTHTNFPIIFQSEKKRTFRILAGTAIGTTVDEVFLIENQMSGGVPSSASTLLNLFSRPSGAATSAIQGASIIVFSGKDSTSSTTPYRYSIIEAGCQNHVTASRAGYFDFKVIRTGGLNATSTLKINGTGQIQFAAYTSLSAFPGTSVASLGVDNAGNIITITGGSGSSPLTTKGDLYTFDTTNARLPVGTNGQVLVVDNTTATGLRWTSTGSGTYTSSNGITLTGINFSLGGNLDADTTITHTTDSLTFTGEGSLPAAAMAKSLVHINNTQTAAGNSWGLEVLGGSKGSVYFETTQTVTGTTVPTFGGQPFIMRATSQTATAPPIWFESGSRQCLYIKTGVTFVATSPSVAIENAQPVTPTNAAYSLNLYTTRSAGITNVLHGRSLINWSARTNTLAVNDFAQIEGGVEDFNNATKSGSLDFKVLASGGTGPISRMKINPTGQIQLAAYTSLAAFPGTSVASLGVDNAGNIITITGGTGSSPLTTKGDLYTFDTTNARLPVGANGEILIADSTTTTGLKWGTAPSTGLTSVGLTMPTAFTVTNSPLTANGTIAVSLTGLSTQYIDGTGNLQTLPTSPLTTKGDLYTFGTADTRLPVGASGQMLYADSTTATGLKWDDAPAGGGAGGGRSYYLNGSINQGTFAGIVDMKEMSPVPISGAGTNFVINADGYIASFITDAGDPNKVLIPAGNWNFELWFGASSGGGIPSFYVELSKYDTVGGTFTAIASGSGAPENITGGAVVDLYFTALSIPQTTLALTDRLAVRVWVTHSSKTITLYTEDNRFSQIITSFPSGIASLNGLTAFSQSLAVGTAGTDFDISSSVSTHTFNLPTASASNRGALSSGDWTTFNNKQATITGAATTITTSDLTVNKALISNTSGKVEASSSVVGYNLATLTDPSQTTYLKINSDNTVTALTAAQLRTDLGFYAQFQSTQLTNSSSTAGVDITGLTINLEPNSTYLGRMKIASGAVNAAGYSLTFTFPAGATMNIGRLSSSGNALTTQILTFQNGIVSGTAVPTNFGTGINQGGYTEIEIYIATTGTGGSFVSTFRSGANGNLVTIYPTVTSITMQKI
jgi:hypothetical protein